ncbi:RDD family protein [Candidatus Daviesbacteria bacterium]|nr:RDD family protein [Candidatus Daviesbacteria bacterium]
MNYAGFWIRFVAALLDSVIILVLSVIVSTVFAVIKLAAMGSLMQLVLTIGYYVWYQSRTGQTLGKKVMKIKVVNAAGTTPSLGTFALREILGKLASGLILGIGYLMVAWDSKKQGLHDKIASTYVVRV